MAARARSKPRGAAVHEALSPRCSEAVSALSRCLSEKEEVEEQKRG